jgi:hypothetical protein
MLQNDFSHAAAQLPRKIDSIGTSVGFESCVHGGGRRILQQYLPCVDGSELARAFFTFAALVGAAMCSAC